MGRAKLIRLCCKKNYIVLFVQLVMNLYEKSIGGIVKGILQQAARFGASAVDFHPSGRRVVFYAEEDSEDTESLRDERKYRDVIERIEMMSRLESREGQESGRLEVRIGNRNYAFDVKALDTINGRAISLVRPDLAHA